VDPSPQNLIDLGHFYSPLSTGISSFTDFGAVNQNLSVYLPPDLIGCLFDDPMNLSTGKALVSLTPSTADCCFYAGYCELKASIFDFHTILYQWEQKGVAAFVILWERLFLNSFVTLPQNGNSGGQVFTKPVAQVKYVRDAYLDPTLFYTYDIHKSNLVSVHFYLDPTVFDWNTYALIQTTTVLLEGPDSNNFLAEVQSVGTPMSFVYWTCIALSLIALIFAVAKLFCFMVVFGIRISLATVVLSFVVFSSWWLFFYRYFASPPYSVIPADPSVWFRTHYYPYMLCAVVIYCFYLIEVSTLTQSKMGGNVFSKFLIPCVAMCGVLWLVEVITSSLIIGTFWSDVGGTDFDNSFDAYNISYLLIISLTITLLLVSSVLFSWHIMGHKQLRGMFIRVLICNFLALTFIILTMLHWIWLTIDRNNNFNQPQYSYWVTLSQAMLYIPSALLLILIASFFRVSLEKEIEISKSGTSSTSGSSSSSGSSKSSSSLSNAEPVIEL